MRLFLSRWAMNTASWTLISGVAFAAGICLLGFVQWRLPDPQWLRLLRLSLGAGIVIGFWSTLKEGK
jgi:hypothetical protein